MSIFTRFSEIINSNINAMLDKAEDPEKMTRLMIREMEDTLVELKSSCSKTIATKSGVEREKKDLEIKLQRWEERAKLALEHNREDLAKEALLEKQAIKNQLDITTNDILHYNKMIEECKSNILQLEERLETVSQKYRILIQRGKHAQEKQRAQDVIRNSSGTDAVLRFEELEKRIERMEAQAEVSTFSNNKAVDDEFSKLEADTKIAAELDELKKAMKGKPSAPVQVKDTEK